MKSLHNILNNKFSSYRDWHNNPNHPHIHWASFVAISMVAAFFVVNAVNNTYQIYNPVLTSHQAKAAISQVGSWALDSQGSTSILTVPDGSGNGNNGAWNYSNSLAYYVPGRIADAASFD